MLLLMEQAILSSEKVEGGNLYMCKVSVQGEAILPVETVEDNRIIYTKRQLKLADEAKELSRSLGYPATRVLLDMVRSGLIQNYPVTAADIHRALAIYGPDLASLRGKSRRSKPAIVRTEASEYFVEKIIDLHCDIMFIEGIPFFVSVSTPLEVIVVTMLGNRKTETLKKALLGHIRMYTSYGFKVKTLLTDGEGGVMKLRQELNEMGIVVNPSGAGSHAPRIETAIRVIKERVRGHISVLPFRLNMSLLVWLVYYCVSRINLVPTSSLSMRVSPKELLTGRRVDFKKELSLSFGDYVEVIDKMG